MTLLVVVGDSTLRTAALEQHSRVEGGSSPRVSAGIRAAALVT